MILFRYKLAIFLVMAFSWLTGSQSAVAQTNPSADAREATLEERLMSVLRVRRESEKKFIKYVLILVKQKKLSQKTVDEAFFWVRRELERKRQGDPKAAKHIEKYPYFYFVQILKRNAARSGVVLKIP